MSKARKIAMIGIDSANFGIVQSNLAVLPNFARVLKAGVFRPLESSGDLIAGSVWPSFYTGKAPGDHGVYHILQWDLEAMRLRRLAEEWFYCEPFWIELERAGLNATVVDAPVSFPTHLKQGIEVSNWGVHNPFCPFATNRAGMARDIKHRFGKHPMGYEIPVKKPARELVGLRDRLIAGAKIKGELSRWVLGARSWDFFMTVLGEAHHGGHTLWPVEGPVGEAVPPNALREVYRAVDDALGVVLDALDLADTTVIIFSPHGMGPNHSKEYLTQVVVDRVNSKFMQGNQNAAARGIPLEQHSLIRSLRYRVPVRLQNAIARSVPLALRDFVIDRSLTAGHDWAQTPAIAVRGDVNGYVRLNLRGRERDGMLDSEGRRRYEDLLRDCMLSLRSAESGNPVVREVYKSEEKFPGGRHDFLPDLIVAWSDERPPLEVHSPMLGTIRGLDDTGPRGHHRSEGFMITLDPGLEHGTEASSMRVDEIAPMILRRLLTSQPRA
jgi:predicted AlkP superfamily phosphohydrolase/phosphomutase